MVGGECRVDRRAAATSHERTKSAHPLGGAVTSPLRGIDGTPLGTLGLKPVHRRVKHARYSLDHILIAHLHGKNRISPARGTGRTKGAFPF
jgi:hypothetical protein